MDGGARGMESQRAHGWASKTSPGKGSPHGASRGAMGLAPARYRISSKNRSSQVSSLMSMNLLQISVTMFITPWYPISG